MEELTLFEILLLPTSRKFLPISFWLIWLPIPLEENFDTDKERLFFESIIKEKRNKRIYDQKGSRKEKIDGGNGDTKEQDTETTGAGEQEEGTTILETIGKKRAKLESE